VKLSISDDCIQAGKPAFTLRMTKLAPAWLALFFMAIAVPIQAEVYKWVDENGRAHYTDKLPRQGEHTQLRAPAATNTQLPAPAATNTRQDVSVQSDEVLSEDEANRRGREWYRQQMVEMERFNKKRDEKIRAEQEKFKADQKAEQKRRDDKIAASQSQDNELIAECKRNREVYCDKGLDKIKTEQELRRIEQEEDRKRARYNPVVPRYTGNDIYIR
jgi:hypothetical protein